MLILPLHRPPTMASLPWATIVLVLVNVFVFFALQSGDDALQRRAMMQYVESGLAQIEAPQYHDYLAEHGSERARRRAAQFAAAPEPMRLALLGQLIDLDFAFQAHLASGSAMEAEEQARWRELRARHEAQLDRSFTWRYLHRGNEFDPVRMVSAAFLHGGFGHLLGNMVFLVLIGVLVEGALGAWRHLLLYVVGAFGASAASLAWHWGSPAAGLGASGAVAAIMGAYCVLWGLRRVRFFYWFVVVFDYVRAPAIVLLPLWLGWEVYNLLANPEVGIGFDAHAGGLVTGAAFALVMRWRGWCVEGFLDAPDEDEVEDVEARLATAMAHLGRMELAEAEPLLASIEEDDPGRPDVAMAAYRCARYAGNARLAGQRLAQMLAAGSRIPLEERAKAVDDAARNGVELPPEGLSNVVRGLVDRHRVADAAALLSQLPADFDPAMQSRLWFVLGLAGSTEGGGGSRKALETLLSRFPDSAEAGKARVLLGG